MAQYPREPWVYACGCGMEVVRVPVPKPGKRPSIKVRCNRCALVKAPMARHNALP